MTWQPAERVAVAQRLEARGDKDELRGRRSAPIGITTRSKSEQVLSASPHASLSAGQRGPRDVDVVAFPGPIPTVRACPRAGVERAVIRTGAARCKARRCAARRSARSAPPPPPPPAPPPPPPRTKWTRCVPHPVLTGHAASLTPY